MKVKRSAITIDLSTDEKKTFDNFYDFLDNMTRELYEANAEHTEFCATLDNIMKEIMTLYEFWGDILEEEEEEPKPEENITSWDYINEIMEKYLFYDSNGKIIPYPYITIRLTVRDWLNEFHKIYTNASSLRVFEKLSKPALDFFIVNTKFPFLDEKVGYHVLL